jgi:uncharacterized protein YkwD
MRTIFILFLVALNSFETYSQKEDWNSEEMNTGKSASYLSPMDKEVLIELNKVRTNPGLYAELYVIPILSHFKGNIDTTSNVETNEGVKAIKECILALKKTDKMGILHPDESLARVAKRHTSAQSKTDQTGHTSPDGETFEERLRNVKFMRTGECLSYGDETARSVVTSLLIDDGVPTRGHRKIILTPGFSSAGISSGKHKEYKDMCTIDFGGGEKPK